MTNSLSAQRRSSPAPGHRLLRLAPGPAPGEGRRRGWTPERCARQAAAIRAWQPWRTSTGPRTDGGKARSAENALKHGLRSRATIERRREDRRILALSARNIAIGRAVLRTLAANANPLPGPALRDALRELASHLEHPLFAGRLLPA